MRASWSGPGPGWALAAVALLAAAASAAAQAEAPLVALPSAELVLRMSQAMAWPDRFSAVAEVSAASASRTPGGQEERPAPLRVRVTGFPPDLYAWGPESSGAAPSSGVAYRGWVQLKDHGPGPRFAYSYSGLPFLDALRVHFAVFRPLPSGARLVMGRSTLFLGREAVEATLIEAETGRRAALVVDRATGLILQAATTGLGGRLLVRAEQVRGLPEPVRVEYAAPILGSAGRLTLQRLGGRWFPVEAVVGSEPPHRVRFADVRLGEQAGDLPRPDAPDLVRLRDLDDRAERAYQAGRNPEAVRLYREMVSIDPYNIHARNRLGYLAMQAGDWATAAAEFEQVIHLAPRSPVGYNNLAYLYTRLRVRLPEALELAEKAVDLAGDGVDAGTLDTYGWALLHNGQLEEAVRVLERAVGLSGNDPKTQAEILYHLGVAKLRQSQVEEARRLLSRALELDPSLGEAREALGHVQSGGAL